MNELLYAGSLLHSISASSKVQYLKVDLVTFKQMIPNPEKINIRKINQSPVERNFIFFNSLKVHAYKTAKRES